VATAKKKPTTKKTAHKTAAHAPVKSFRVAKPTMPFFNFDFTIQTVYWLVLSALVVSLGLWVMSLNMQVQELYDQIDQTNQEIILPVTK
jgi:cell division protein FtsL